MCSKYGGPLQACAGCSPWFLPPAPGTAVCSPWQAASFSRALRWGRAPEGRHPRAAPACHCPSDCNSTSYSVALSSSPLRCIKDTFGLTPVPARRCDSRNLVLSPLCGRGTGLQATAWLEDVAATYTTLGAASPDYLAGRQGRSRSLYAYQADRKDELISVKVILIELLDALLPSI